MPLAGDDKLPMGKPAQEWTYGDLDAGFKDAKVVLDESFVVGAMGHHCMEPRSAMAYWQNGKVFVFGSSQSQSFMMPGLARYCGVEPKDLVYIAEYCGGGFGSKGTPYPIMSIPAHMSRKLNGRPVMMRISRHEEYAVGSGRAGFQGRIKVGFRADGRITAMDAYVVAENGANIGFWDFENFGHTLSVVYQPLAMRWRGMPVLTNTPARGPQRGPGENQTAVAMEPIMDKAARQLGLDRVAIRLINAPDNDGKEGEKQGPMTSAFLKDALQKGADRFKWEEKAKLSRPAQGLEGDRRRRRLGLPPGRPDRLRRPGADHARRQDPHPHRRRQSRHLLLRRHLARGGRSAQVQLGELHPRARRQPQAPAVEFAAGRQQHVVHAVAHQLRGGDGRQGEAACRSRRPTSAASRRTTTSAARRCSSSPIRRSRSPTPRRRSARSSSAALSAARRRLPTSIRSPRLRSPALAGTGLIGVAKDKLAIRGMPPALAAGFVMIELDTETGRWDILEYLGVADCGTVIHPQGLGAQVEGGAVMGIGMASTERYVLDPQLGIPANVGFLSQKPVELPRRALRNAMGCGRQGRSERADRLARHRRAARRLRGGRAPRARSPMRWAGVYFNKTPVVADMIVNAIAKRPQSYKALAANTQ